MGAIVATAKDLKIAGLRLLVQMLSSHELVEKAFGAGSGDSEIVERRKLVMFTEHLVTDLERLRDGMAPSLAALQGGGNDLLCMWSLLTLRALCANVGFRSVLLSSHTSVLGLLSSFEHSRNPCVAHIAESTRRLIGGNVDQSTAVSGAAAVSGATDVASSAPTVATYGGSTSRQYGQGQSLKVATPPPAFSKPPPPSYGNGVASNASNLSSNGTSGSTGRSPYGPPPPSYGGATAQPPAYLMEKTPDPSPPLPGPPSQVPKQSVHHNSGPSFAPVNVPVTSEDAKVQQLVEMGFNAHQARLTLEAVGWDVQKAVAVLSSDTEPRAPTQRSSTTAGGHGKRPLRFKIPPGVSPGQTVTIQDSATGKKHAVRIPNGASPGSELQIYV